MYLFREKCNNLYFIMKYLRDISFSLWMKILHRILDVCTVFDIVLGRTIFHQKLSWLKENKNNENMNVSMSENMNVSMWFRVWVWIKAWWFTASSRCSRESRSFDDDTNEAKWKRKKGNCSIFSVKTCGCLILPVSFYPDKSS